MDPLDLVLRDLIDTVLGENVYGAPDALRADDEWCRIPVTGGALVFRRRDGGPLQPYRLSRGPVWHVGDTERELTPVEVLALLGDRRELPAHNAVLADLRTAVEHTEVTRAGWSALRDRALRPGGLLTGERLAATRNRPFHPTARAVSGWSADELAEYGPMRQRPMPMCWVAVRRDRLRHGEHAESHRLERLLLDGSEQDCLADAMTSSGANATEYQPVPVHPWQFDRVLHAAWADEIAAHDVVPLDCRAGRFQPTASLRTLTTAPETDRHLKVPLGVATLGAARLLPPRYLDNGDKAQRMLRWLLDTDPALAERVALCDETAWCGWHADAADEFADRPGELAAQVRRYPSDILGSDTIALPMAALAAHEWQHIAPALGVDDPVAFFRGLATDFCAMMFAFLGHGVLPELHGQNVVVLLSGGGPVRFVLRDHDTVRVCPQWMSEAGTPDPGYRIKPGAPQSLSLDAPETLIGYAQTLGFQVNLYGIADAIARHYDLDERVLWHALADAVTTAIDVTAGGDTLRATLLDAPDWPRRQVLGPLLRAGRNAGVSMPAATGSVPNPLRPLRAARRASRQRLLNAYLRESGRTPAPTGDGLVRVPLGDGRAVVVALRYRSEFGHHTYGDDVWLACSDGMRVPLTHDELVTLLLDEVAGLATAAFGETGDGETLARQITGSVEATARYLQVGSPSHADPARNAEQSLRYGHPFHPTPKSIDGFGDELPRYAPELGAEFRLHWFAVRADAVAERRVAPGEWVPPRVARHAPPGYALLPVHPWQSRYVTRQQRVAELLADGTLVALGELGGPVYPTSSVRTVCDPAFDTSWKLPLHVRITNFVRTNPAEHLHRAADASALIARLAAGWQHDRFGVLLETGYRAVDPAVVGDELAADFAVLFRQHPFVDGDYAPRVVAGLLEDRDDGVPTVIEEVRRSGGPVREWLRCYLRLAVLPLFDVFERDGVSFEAHVQNSLLHTEDGWPARFWVRDMEGTSVSAARQPGLDPASPLRYSDDEAWLRLRYHAIGNHLGHLIGVLGRHGDGERPLWTAAREVLLDEGGTLAHDLVASRVVPVKANLISRFAGRGERPLYVDVPNPLYQVSL